MGVPNFCNHLKLDDEGKCVGCKTQVLFYADAPAESVSPAPQPEHWRKAGVLFTDPPDMCDVCDSKEFISAGPNHFECYRCSLERESDWLRTELEKLHSEYVSLREELAKITDAYTKQVEHTNVVRTSYQEMLKASDTRLAEARKTLEKIDAIRNDIVGTQSIGWSAHVYPLVAALLEAGYEGKSYEECKADAEKARMKP